MNSIETFRKDIERILIGYLPEVQVVYHKEVIEALRYSFEIGGKRIRPMLMYGAYSMMAKEAPIFKHRVIESFMAAIEMIHTYSLIHDDLPAMDNDDLRRGKPTCHVKFGEANAILAGDGLLNCAFELMLKTALNSALEQPEKSRILISAMYEMSLSSGVYGMIGGQAADMYFEKNELQHKGELDYIHEHKTGAIICSSLVIGGILAGADESDINTLKTIGKNIGISFQIQDDILDCLSTVEKLGKPIGSDLKNNKKTSVSFIGLEQSKLDVIRLLETAKAQVLLLSEKNSLLIEIIDFLMDREY